MKKIMFKIMFKNLIKWLVKKIINLPFYFYSFLIVWNSLMLLLLGRNVEYVDIVAKRFVELSIIDISEDQYLLVPLSFFLFHYFLYMLHPNSAPLILNWWKEDSEMAKNRINFFQFIWEWGCMFSPEKIIKYKDVASLEKLIEKFNQYQDEDEYDDKD